MSDININEFKLSCKEYLSKQGITALRPYGRSVGVAEPTKKKKEELIEAIIAVLTGEIPPVPRSKKGAPVKDDFVDPNLENYMQALCLRYTAKASERETDVFDVTARLKNAKENEWVLTVEDPNARELEINGVREIFKGQLETLNGVSMLLPLNCMDSPNKIVVSVEMIRAFDLREGDVVTCYAEKRNNILVATTILTVNELVVDSFHRVRFDECVACFPQNKMHFYDGKQFSSLTAKCLEWLTPMGKGQRGLLLAPPKSGKSSMFLEIVRSAKKLNKSMQVFTLLVDQPPENIGQFRKYCDADNLVYTTYEDDPERQVFAAEFLLKRAKRYAECGLDVLLIVDSFNALARAYNDTKDSSGGKVFAGGLEGKTIQFVKRYFGSARCLERGGSVTILASLSTDTGNPADELLKSELAAIGNLEIRLSDELAKRRIYPAIDLVNSQGKGTGTLLGMRWELFDGFLRSEYLPTHSVQELFETLSTSTSLEELEEKLTKKKK